MDPNYADAYAMRAWNRHYSGEPEKALEGFEYALVLNPRAPFPYLNALAEVYFSLGDYEQSIRFNIEATSRNPEALRNRIFLAAAYSEMDRIEDAEWEVEEALLLQPDLSLSNLEDIAPYRDPATAERLLKALRAAGLPE
jgi:tetratricopeptide (TPR) repeat protein